MAQFAVGIYREKGGGYRGTMDGWGEVKGRTLAETIRLARETFSRMLDGGFPDRTGIDPAGADLVVWFDIALKRRCGAIGMRSTPASTKDPAVPDPNP